MGGVWSSRNFNAIGPNLRNLFPSLNGPIQEKDDAWALFWNFDQFLVEDRCDPGRDWACSAVPECPLAT
jgi:hypothetical protein